MVEGKKTIILQTTTVFRIDASFYPGRDPIADTHDQSSRQGHNICEVHSKNGMNKLFEEGHLFKILPIIKLLCPNFGTASKSTG